MTSLLIVDDDKTFASVLADSFTDRGTEVTIAYSAEEALDIIANTPPEYAVLDLKMPGDSGLTLIPKLLEADPFTRIVVLTGYASITTAVEAIKLGAVHYLAKPVGTEEIIAAFEKTQGDPMASVEDDTLKLNEVKWQHIKAALARNDGNISATARELGMHRRTLQRKLDKMPS